MRIGVLASQGAFAEHIAILLQLEVEALPVRLPQELASLDGLIIPGGESTSISKLIKPFPGVFIRVPIIEQANSKKEIRYEKIRK